MNTKILILDIETTGFLKQGGLIVEIGITELCTLTGVAKVIYNQVCKEEGMSPEHADKPYGWIFDNSDLTMFEVNNGANFELVKREVQEIINSYPLGITAFNKKFDFDFLKDRGFIINNELPCLMHSCTHVVKIKNKGRKGYKWPSVQEAFNYFYPDVDYVEKHRGGDDSLHEAMIASKLIELGIIKL